jgi:hypothetical protein
MHATLHLPNAAPRLLTASELAALAPHQGNSGLTLDFEATAPALRELLGTSVPGEVLGCGPEYFIVSVENAADLGFGATLSATTDFERLTGVELEEDEPLVGPLLIIEA